MARARKIGAKAQGVLDRFDTALGALDAVLAAGSALPVLAPVCAQTRVLVDRVRGVGDVAQDALDMAEQQKDQLEDLLQQMEQVSREAEDSERLLSNELEDGIRRARQENMEQSLDQLSLLMRNNLPEETGDIQRDLTENISELRDSVEEAAEKIIGNDEDAMRFAADQLDDLREGVQREMENALSQQRQGEPQGGREQQGNEPNPLGQAEGENREGQPGQGQAQPEEGEPRENQ